MSIFEKIIRIVVRCGVIFLLSTLSGLIYSEKDTVLGKLCRIVNMSINIVCGCGIVNLLVFIFTGCGVDLFATIGDGAVKILSKINMSLIQVYAGLAIILVSVYLLRLLMLAIAFIFSRFRTDSYRESIHILTRFLFAWVGGIITIVMAHVYIFLVLKLTSVIL